MSPSGFALTWNIWRGRPLCFEDKRHRSGNTLSHVFMVYLSACLSFFFPDLWKANVPSEHTVEKEVCWSPCSKVKENHHRCGSGKDVFLLNLNWRGLLSGSVQSNMLFSRELWCRCPCRCRNPSSNVPVPPWARRTHQTEEPCPQLSERHRRCMSANCRCISADEERAG